MLRISSDISSSSLSDIALPIFKYLSHCLDNVATDASPRLLTSSKIHPTTWRALLTSSAEALVCGSFQVFRHSPIKPQCLMPEIHRKQSATRQVKLRTTAPRQIIQPHTAHIPVESYPRFTERKNESSRHHCRGTRCQTIAG